MKHLLKFLILAITFLIVFYSCEEETFTEEDAIELIQENSLQADSVNNKNVELSVKVIDASVDFATKGQGDVSVSINIDGETVTKTTDANGTVSFTGLEIGNFAVNVSAQGYTTVDFVTETESYGNYSVQVPILSTTSGLMTVSGKVTYEDDLLNTSRENAEGVMVVAQPDLPDYFGNIPFVREIAYSGFSNTDTTNSAGEYSILVPADKAGELTYDISVPVFEKEQSLLLNEYNGNDVTGPGNTTQTVMTRFGTDLYGSATAVPDVSPVYCVFSEPTHTFEAAELAVETDNNKGVDKVYVTDAGADYYDAYDSYNPRVVIDNSNSAGSDAVVELHVHDATGQIEWIEVVNTGSDFTIVPTLDLSFEQDDAEIQVAAVNGTGGITAVSITDGGEYLTNQLTISGGSGSGASVNVDWNFVNETFEVDDVWGGSGYVVGDNLNVNVPTTTASASVTMQKSYISSVQVLDEGTGYPKNGAYSINFSYGNAEATAYTDDFGGVYKVEVDNGGNNYTTTPEAEVEYEIFNKTATAKVNVQDGEIVGIYDLEEGAGYETLPDVSFYSQYESGNPTLALDYDIAIDNGHPYGVLGLVINNSPGGISKNMSTKAGDSAKINKKSIPGGKILEDFYLGTGVRTGGN